MTCGPFRTVETIEGVSAAGTIPDGLWSYSVYNAGNAAGTLGGVSIPAGATIRFEGYYDFNIKRLSGMAYDATGTTFVITTTP